MCILFIYRDPKADCHSFRLIVISNRDEVLNRPAKPAHYWEKHPHCLGGTDMEPGKEGGTWLALSTKGQAGAILTLSGESKHSQTPKEGRGFLVADYVTSDESCETYLNKLYQIDRQTEKYNPYTLVLFELANANVRWLSSPSDMKAPQTSEEKILGFGNSPFDQPYKKVQVGKETFEILVKNASVKDQQQLIQNLLEFLKCSDRHLPDEELRKRSPEFYPALSSIFVQSETKTYGTRTHSILLVDGTGRITFIEETLMPDESWKRQQFQTHLQ
ncbi:transport and Golgi organization protein 2 isoform X1 [Leptopilina heterotoma]|uniref:transport and Golgi organization protein 2 isoform X1 n=2 Tax=Leptopilina heterotoma TaxID=63436 RepID=UPI001CA7D61F|nr:transport and Golgi organization protein 2 isoform X1 [Leptopilina heterotoma]